MTELIQIQKCPHCFQMPKEWIEQPQYGSRKLYWFGCKPHGHLAGGVTKNAAVQNWNRLILRWKMDHKAA